MLCHDRQMHRTPADRLPVRPPHRDARVGDAERNRTALVLGDAAAAGYLPLDELERRLTATWAATSAGQLDDIEADLPDGLRQERARVEAAARARDEARLRLPGHLRTYAAVMLLLCAVWLAGGSWYPWVLWSALGWGIGVAGHVRAATARVPS